MSVHEILKLNPLFTDGMILQREKPVKIWGEAGPLCRVTAKLQGQTVTTQANEKGEWMAEFAPLHASLNEVLILSAGSVSTTLEDIAIGEVWVAGGQSNMEFEMAFEKQRTGGRKFENRADIRFFDIPEVCYPGELEAFDYSQVGHWRKVTDTDIDWFSAVGYYFAEKLNGDLKVPVGIIGCNWGGTRSMHWMEPKHVEEIGKVWFEDFRKRLEGLDLEAFWAKQNANFMNDHGRHIYDPFTSFIMPKTRSQEELQTFFAKQDNGFVWGQELMPQEFPGCLYENMVKRLAPYTVRGIIWYQGESDDDLEKGTEIYDLMLKTLISDWRKLWKENLPFLMVELAGFEQWLAVTAKNYPTLRAKQRQVAQEETEVYITSITDAGEQFDIHPKDKAIVGLRLALLAEGHVYDFKKEGKVLVCDGPEAYSIEKSTDGKQLSISFKNVGDGLWLKGNRIPDLKLRIGGKEISYRFRVERDCLIMEPINPILQNQAVEVELGWTNWHCINLYNSAEIPAFPFRFEL